MFGEHVDIERSDEGEGALHHRDADQQQRGLPEERGVAIHHPAIDRLLQHQWNRGLRRDTEQQGGVHQDRATPVWFEIGKYPESGFHEMPLVMLRLGLSWSSRTTMAKDTAERRLPRWRRHSQFRQHPMH